MSSSEDSGDDDRDKAIHYHEKYVLVSDELKLIKEKYNSLFTEMRKFKVSELGEDMSHYKVFVDFFDAISMFPGVFANPVPDFKIRTLIPEVLREVTKDEIRHFNQLKDDILNWKVAPEDRTNPFLKSINLLKQNLQNVDFNVLMSAGYRGPGDYNSQNLFAKKFGVNFRLIDTITVEKVMSNFPRFDQTLMKVAATYCVSHHFYALTERMAFWQDFELIRKQYTHFIGKASLAIEGFEPLPETKKTKGEKKEKETRIRKEVKEEKSQSQPISSKKDTKSQGKESSTQTENMQINKYAQTDIAGSEAAEVLGSDIPDLIRNTRKLKTQLEMSMSDHRIEREEIEEKYKKELKDKEVEIEDLKRRSSQLMNEQLEIVKESREENLELKKELEEFKENEKNLDARIKKTYESEIKSLRNLNKDLNEQIRSKEAFRKIGQEGMEEQEKQMMETIGGSIVRYFLARGYRPETNDDSEQWSTTAFLEDLFKTISYPFEKVLVAKATSQEDLYKQKYSQALERCGELSDRNEDLKNKLLALEMDGSQRAKTLFENAMNIFEDKLFKNAVNNVRQINELSEKLKNDYTATHGMYERMDAARRQLASDLSRSQNAIHSLNLKTPIHKIARQEVRVTEASKLFRELPELKGDETSEEMQIIKNIVRDNIAYNERLQLNMRPPNVSYKEWFSKFYQFVKK